MPYSMGPHHFIKSTMHSLNGLSTIMGYIKTQSCTNYANNTKKNPLFLSLYKTNNLSPE